MTAEETIKLIETAAKRFPIIDLSSFVERAREDISLYRREVPYPFEKKQFSKEFTYPEPRPEFKIPKKYQEHPEIWLVFSSFVCCFIDPIDFAIHISKSFKQVKKEVPIGRFTLASEIESEDDHEDLEVLDLKRLERDLKDMIDITGQLGEELFGDIFTIYDFWGEEPQKYDRE